MLLLRRSRALSRIGGLCRLSSTAKPTIGITFVLPTGVRVAVRAPLGDSMLEVAHANKIDVEGACGGARRGAARPWLVWERG